MQKGNVTVGSSGKKAWQEKREVERYTRSKIRRSKDQKIPKGPKVPRSQGSKEPQSQDQGDRVFAAFKDRENKGNWKGDRCNQQSRFTK